VRDQVESDEEPGVRERVRGDLGLPRDVDAREADGGQQPDDEEVEELSVACSDG
jgi:hypothetical protein